MFLAYFDESGDDGFPGTSSPLFVQTAVYMHHKVWREAFNATQEARRELAQQTPFKFHVELHTRELLLDKNPYHALRIPPPDRLEIVRAFCRHIATLNLRIINVVIDKQAITREPEYPVLDRAVTYLIQRIENDLLAKDDAFLIITDEGRVGKMRATARRLQKINYVPSKFGLDSRRRDIKQLIEDPLPKRSHESYFIQFADLAACLCQLQMQTELGAGTWPNRLKAYARPEDITAILELLRPRLNLKASAHHPLGIVCYPKR